MNADVLTALTTELTAFGAGLVDVIESVLPVALPVLLTIVGLFFAIRIFRGIARI